MKYTTFSRGGYTGNAVSELGGDVDSAVYLMRDPVGALEAATKAYADNSTTTIHASAFQTGILPNTALPAFTGDINKLSKSNQISLAPSGVSPGTYSKVSVDLKGRVTAGGSLVESDLPGIPFNKVSPGKPTNLAGYGIIDALSSTGGNLSGKLTLVEVGNDQYSILNKEYIDTYIETSGQGVATGGIVYKATEGPHVGYLKTNGGLVDKSTYGALYEAIGDRYGQYYRPGAGKPWVNQFTTNFEETAALGTWELEGTLVEAISGAKALVTMNHISLMGGRTSSAVRNNTRRANITNKSLGNWGNGPAMARARYDSEVLVTRNAVINIGGRETVDGAPASTVYLKYINTGNGTIGSSSGRTSLPIPLANTKAVITVGKLFVIAGETTMGPSAAIYETDFDSYGRTGSWTLVGNLPEGLTGHQATVIGDWVYVLGGSNASGATDTILRSPIDSNGNLGAWVQAGTLPNVMSNFEIIVTNHKLFVLGKHNTTGEVNSSMSCPINPDGSLGVWTYGPAVPETVGSGSLVVTEDSVYILGGTNDSGVITDQVYRTDFIGGSNSYKDQYAVTPENSVSDPTKFALPNITTELLGVHGFIKT